MTSIVHALYYVPLKDVTDLPGLMKKLRVRYTVEDKGETDGDAIAETVVSPDSLEIKCYSLALKGYIGVPRSFGFQNFPHLDFQSKATRRLRMPHLIPRTITPRDAEQAAFWNDLAAVCMGPRPNDVIVNAKTGSGKTETALWLFQNYVQSPMLITVPTNKLRRQWYDRIVQRFGQAWTDRYVGHIQQDKTDYEGRLIVIGLAPSLAFREYPNRLRNYFDTIWFDEFHKIGAPKMSRILDKYGASLRIGGTATNRRDALKRVCDLHMGKPRVVSAQEVMKPKVFEVPFRTAIPKQIEVKSSFTVRWALARSPRRNELVARLIYEKGYLRNRNVLFLSDNVEQIQKIIGLLVDGYGLEPDTDVGMIVGEYKTGRWRVNRNGKSVPEKIKMKEADQDRVAAVCKIIGATYGIFDTGADVARLDMGVEATPRTNVRQAMGRTQRLLSGKPEVEWYSITDEVWYYPRNEEGRRESQGMFAPNRPIERVLHEETVEANEARRIAFADQGGVIHPFSF